MACKEFFRTHGTLKVPHSLVTLQMITQIAAVAKLYTAYVANTVQSLRSWSFVSADIAESSSFRLVYLAYMTIKVGKSFEIYVTDITFEGINVSINETELFVEFKFREESLFVVQTTQTFLFVRPVLGSHLDNTIFNAFRINFLIGLLLEAIAHDRDIVLLGRSLIKIRITNIPQLRQIFIDFDEFKGNTALINGFSQFIIDSNL